MLITHKARLPGDPLTQDLFECVGMILGADTDCTLEWTPERIQTLRDTLLKRSAAQIEDDRVGENTLKDIEDWVHGVDADDDANPFAFACIIESINTSGMPISYAVETAQHEYDARLAMRRARMAKQARNALLRKQRRSIEGSTERLSDEPFRLVA